MLLAMAVLAVSTIPFADVRAAAPVNAISYQGRLLNSSGVPVADTSLEFVFRLFDASSGGTCLWESDDGVACDNPDETQTVAITEGLFSENIGSTIDPEGLSEAYPVDLSGVFEASSAVYLEVQVDGEILTPRKQIVAAPYALNAQSLDGLDSTAFLSATGDTATGDFDFTGTTLLGGSPLVFEGATSNEFETSFAITDPTADRTITVQNADGTLAFLTDIPSIPAGASLWETGVFSTFENDDDVVIGTDGDETITDLGFVLNGNDLFVAGDTGVKGVMYAEGGVISGADLLPDADHVRSLGSGTYGWLSLYLRNTDDSATVSLSSDGTGETDSGASVIGIFDEFANSAGGNVQDTLDDLDAAIATGGAGALWTLSSGVAYPTAASTDFAIGGTAATSSPFGVDESTNTVYVGEGSGSNGTVAFKASDADAGSLAYTTDDRWTFTGGDAFVGAAAVGSVMSSFSPSGDDLYVAGDIAAQANVYADAFVAGDSASATYGDALLNTTSQDYAANIAVSGADALTHTLSFQVDGNVGLSIMATGDGAGGVGARVVQVGVSAAADTVTIGDANTNVSLTDAQWSVSSAGDATLASVDLGGTLTLQNDETIGNAADDVIAFTGAGGADNTDFLLNLDGTLPIISSSDSLIGFADNVQIDPDAGNATISLYASDGDTGNFSYITSDSFSFSGGNMTQTALGSFPTGVGSTASGFSTSSTFSGTSGAGLGSITIDGVDVFVTSSAFEGGGGPATKHYLYGTSSTASSTGTDGQAERIIGVRGVATNASSNASAVEGYVAGVYGEAMHDSAGTISDVRGVSGIVHADSGTVTDLYAVRGEIQSGAGTATNGYGGYFFNTNEGSNRFGIVAYATGGGNNYAGYFHTAPVRVETSATASAATVATGAGDLFVDGQLEIDGQGVSAGILSEIDSGELTTGEAFTVLRTSSGTDFTNTTTGLVDLAISDTASTGRILYLSNDGTGTSLYVDPNADTGDVVSDSIGGAVHVTNTGNDDYGLSVYTNNASSDQALAYFYNDNSSFDDYVVDIRSDAAEADTANGTALHVFMDQVDAPGANAVGTQALVLDTNENFGAADGLLSDAMILVREDIGGTADTVFRVDADGDVWADGTLGVGAADVAETYPSTDALVPGELVAVDATGAGVVRTSSAYQPTLIGGVSTLPGVLLGQEDPGYRIGLSGRIPVLVTDENGPIAPGDPITSSSISGFGMKATEPGTIVGFALGSFDGVGTGTVSTFLSPQFYMGSVINTDGSVTQIEDDVELSGSLSVLGSSSGTVERMSLVTDVTDSSDYRLSIENGDGSPVAYVSNQGDLAISGRFYPSDRGAIQTSKYIYYDGSAGAGGDFMRTNASGWATGSYDFAEMFPSSDVLEAGDVVVFGGSNESVARSSEPASSGLAGIVSTRPGFLAGENKPNEYPIALAGRVPTKVSLENGPIKIGDPLTSSSRAGYAMKASDPGMIVGYALEPFDGEDSGKIVAFVSATYWDGGKTSPLPGTDNSASTIVVTQNADNLTSLNMNGNLYMTGNDILGVRQIEGLSGQWSVGEDGTVRTTGVLKTVTESYQGEKVETAAVTSLDVQIVLVGTGTIENGEAVINFEDVSPSFNDVTSTEAPIRVVVTPNGPVSLYVFEKDHDGFGVRQSDGGHDSGVSFDWMVSAYRKGYEPVEDKTEDSAAVVSDDIEDSIAQPETTDSQDTETVDGDAAIEEPSFVDSDQESESAVTDEPASPESPEPTSDDSMESTVVEEPAPQTP